VRGARPSPENPYPKRKKSQGPCARGSASPYYEQGNNCSSTPPPNHKKKKIHPPKNIRNLFSEISSISPSYPGKEWKAGTLYLLFWGAPPSPFLYITRGKEKEPPPSLLLTRKQLPSPPSLRIEKGDRPIRSFACFQSPPSSRGGKERGGPSQSVTRTLKQARRRLLLQKGESFPAIEKKGLFLKINPLSRRQNFILLSL